MQPVLFVSLLTSVISSTPGELGSLSRLESRVVTSSNYNVREGIETALTERWDLLFIEVVLHEGRQGCVVYEQNTLPLQEYLLDKHFFIVTIGQRAHTHDCDAAEEQRHQK